MSKQRNKPSSKKPVKRRDFLGLATLWTFFGTVAATLIGILKLPIPCVFPEADSRFPIGTQEEFPVGQAVHLPSRRLWVFSDENGIAALSTVCRHLGCVVKREEDGEYTCPCHGSKFDAIGKVLYGPSPRGLAWLEISLGPDGRLIVDSKIEVDPQKRFKT